jgi:hypothetical protein
MAWLRLQRELQTRAGAARKGRKRALPRFEIA